jgi:hypothetical protein
VGKGIHSLNHIAKLRPEIENLCRQHQFKYYIEENEGRIFVKFGEGAGQLSHSEVPSHWGNSQNFGTSQGYPGPSQPQPYQQPQQSYQQQSQPPPDQGGQTNDLEQVVQQAAPAIFKKLGECCIIL